MFQLAAEGRKINLPPSDRSENLTVVKINELGNATGSDKEQRQQSDTLGKCSKTKISEDQLVFVLWTGVLSGAKSMQPSISTKWWP